jgi:hypothetical protein
MVLGVCRNAFYSEHEMNERIEALLIEAHRQTEGGIYKGHLSVWTEKFAVLIVKECMDIAHNVGNISEPDDWALDRCYEIEQRIQDRFGVEE